MRAMVLDEIAAVETAPLQLRDVPIPEPGPGEVRLRVHCSAVCRTDLHVVEGDLRGENARHPRPPGRRHR